MREWVSGNYDVIFFRDSKIENLSTGAADCLSKGRCKRLNYSCCHTEMSVATPVGVNMQKDVFES